MSNRIEPPILMSRLLTFVFAAVLVITLVLLITLYELFPTDRPQIFFLMTQPKENLEISLLEMPPTDEHFEHYKRAFIREYIKARNEVVPDQAIMREKWANNNKGLVRVWSTPKVYTDFAQTDLWGVFMNEIPANFELFSCPVEFPTNAIVPIDENTYNVSFSYFCANSGGQADKKDYTIKMKLELNGNKTMKYPDRLNNPLGMRVSEYKVVSGNGDPLNTGY